MALRKVFKVFVLIKYMKQGIYFTGYELEKDDVAISETDTSWRIKGGRLDRYLLEKMDFMVEEVDGTRNSSSGNGSNYSARIIDIRAGSIVGSHGILENGRLLVITGTRLEEVMEAYRRDTGTNIRQHSMVKPTADRVLDFLETFPMDLSP